MVEVIKFKADHVWFLKFQDHDNLELGSVDRSFYKQAEVLKHSYTIVVNGVISACVGIVDYWNNRGEVWALIDRRSGKSFLSIVRVMIKLLNSMSHSRIEATVIANFKQGHRLVKLLGFEIEANCMKKYGVTGLDYALYARVK